MRWCLVTLWVSACAGEPPADVEAPEDPLCRCGRVALPSQPVEEEAALLALLQETAAVAYPELAGVRLAVASVDELAYFRSVIDLASIGPEDPAGRVYRIQYDPVVLRDPPTPAALVAVLAHELGHVLDYTAMSAQAYAAFGIQYGTEDPVTSTWLSDYERGTDAQALERGCADGLSAMRTWIYDHGSEEVDAEKRHNYFSPEEIAAWVVAHGRCAAD